MSYWPTRGHPPPTSGWVDDYNQSRVRVADNYSYGNNTGTRSSSRSHNRWDAFQRPRLPGARQDSDRIRLDDAGVADVRYPGVEFNHACNDSDGQSFCDCQTFRTSLEECMYFGRQVEPLAFSLPTDIIDHQETCPLFAMLPAEIRHTVYEYAFTDCTSNPADIDNPHRRSSRPVSPYQSSSSSTSVRELLPVCDIAVSLLQTCKAVYLEAYRQPFLLNSFTLYKFGHLPSYDICRPRFVHLAPWQFALISRLDISLRQAELEGDTLKKYLRTWRAQDRHSGAIIAPRFYQETRNRYPGPVIHSFNFRLIDVERLEDGVPVSIRNESIFYPNGRLGAHIDSISTARAMVARPLTHLTLRLSRTDWWTWEDHPSETGVSALGVDPAFGDGRSGDNERPVQPRMLHLASERRAGQWPNPYYKDPAPTRYGAGSWGAEIAQLPDLKVLELVLQTFGAKKTQLETVIDCAKTWRFPLNGVRSEAQSELVWDGKVKETSWTNNINPDSERYQALQQSTYQEARDNANQLGWPEENREVEVRIIRFKRVKVQ